MKYTINFSQFQDAFKDHGRQDNFSWGGLRILFNYFEELDESCGTETELDVIAICCEFSESTPDEIRADYNIPHDQSVESYLSERTSVCGETADAIVYRDF